MTRIKTLAIIFLSLCTLMLSGKDYKASVFGVKSDGVTLNTRSIQKAVDFISENGGGRLVFYVGRYVTGTIQLKSNVTIQLEEGAVLVGTTSVYDYSGPNGVKALISADSLENIGITGKGVIEGQGAAVLDNINSQIGKGYLKETTSQASPVLIYMNSCSKVSIEGINLWNACGNVQFFNDCKDINISNISIKSTIIAGSKGVVLSGCDGAKLTDSFFETYGIEISPEGTSKNILVRNCINDKGKQIQIEESLSAQDKHEDLTRYVNPFIGTKEMGHVFPGACVPFGMVQLSPDTDTIPYAVNGKYTGYSLSLLRRLPVQ